MDSAPPTAATDQPADGENQVRLCARPGCSNPLPAARTRPLLYCSRSCRSKVDRAKAKAREAAATEAEATAAPAAPQPAPDAAPPAAVPAGDDRWGEDGRHLLSLADALRRKLTWFLEESENGDPVAAFKELALRLPGYSHRVYSAAQEIRDKRRWPDLTERERVNRRMLERIEIWGDDTAPADDAQDDGSAPRGESPAPGDHQEQPVPAPAAVDPAPPVTLPRQQRDKAPSVPPEPYLRGLGRFDLIQNISTLMQQPGWDLAGWTRAPGLFYVRKDGRALAWIEHGAARLDGWVVVIEGRFVADPADRSRPLVTSTAELAVLLVRQALEEGLIDADTAPVLG